MQYENILLERNGTVTVLTVNRPQALNALNQATIMELGQAIDEIAQDIASRAVVITGAGEKAFVAGADISEINTIQSSMSGMRTSQSLHDVFDKIAAMPKIVIAAINGYALGGGLELALGCDIRLASEKAQLGLPEVNLGLIPGWGGSLRLQQIVGTSMAKYLVMTGERIAVEEALRLGLVEKVYPAAELMDKALELARTIGSNAPLATSSVKRLLNAAAEMNYRSAVELEKSLFGHLTATEDCKEGTAAFLEKRQPEWKGR